MLVLGFMTGTSLDAIDMALVETDGLSIMALGPAGERPLDDGLRAVMTRAVEAALAWPRGEPEPAVFAEARAAGARAHHEAASAFLAREGLSFADIDLIGYHGQTVLHERPAEGRLGRTIQLGDAQLLADLAGRPVAYDFRSADVAAGGEGAPLAPVYHLARARLDGLAPPLAVLNVGGVANVTLWTGGEELFAFDTGPGNGLIDQLVQSRGAGRCDEKGRYASVGRVDEAALAAYLAHPYFQARPPKSLDRYDFSLAPVETLRLEDAAATLVALTAEAARAGFALLGHAPVEVIVCGGGRHNPEIMRALAERLDAPVVGAEERGWRGDFIEAEAFAFLAARTWAGLALSYPGTTGVPAPQTGGRIAHPAAGARAGQVG